MSADRRVPAYQIAAHLRRHEEMSLSSVTEIAMALAGIVSRSACLSGSKISEDLDAMVSEMEVAMESVEWRLEPME